jgi:NADH:ubiquinone oxidoreductase subunit 2 (subunit N)
VMFESAQIFGAKGEAGLSQIMYGLLVIGGLNTVVSAMYYIKVLKVMILEKRLEEVEGRPVERLKVPAVVKSYASILAAVIIGLGIFWSGLYEWTRTTGVDGFPTSPPVVRER